MSRVPAVAASVADLDPSLVAEVLARHSCNVTDASSELGVRASDLRRLLWARPDLQDAAFEVVEARIDLAEKNIAEALDSEDRRERLAASMFTIRNSARSRRRGWITSSAAVDLTVSSTTPQNIVITWAGGSQETEEIERDGKSISVLRYDAERISDDCLEGSLAAPAALIEHAAPAPAPSPAPEPEPAAAIASSPEPEPAAARYERERIDAWIRVRLPSYPMDRCAHCRGPFVAGQAFQEAANDEVRVRFHAACYAEWRAGREAEARQALNLGS